MKLSIIIVSYNEKDFLEDAIESCLKQKLDYPYEIIIGDDGSNDGSIDILKNYSSKYNNISYFVMDRGNIADLIPSIRVSNVVKRAFSMCSGEYITVMSGDDLLIDENKMNKQITFLDNNSKYVSCYTNFKKFWNDGNEELIEAKINISRMLFWSLSYMHISCFVFRKRVLNDVLDNFCDDTGLIYSIFLSGKTKYLNSMSFGYRQRDKSIMHEADIIELSLVEVLLYEDVLKKNKFKNSSLARFFIPLRHLFKNRSSLKLDKYGKYIRFAQKHGSKVLIKIIDYEKLSFFNKVQLRIKIFKARLLRMCFLINIKIKKSLDLLKKNKSRKDIYE